MRLLNWTPTPEQVPFLQGLDWTGTRETDLLLGSGGIQAGKTEITAMQVMTRLPWVPPGATVWLVGPDYLQARNEMKRLLVWCKKLGWLAGKPVAPRSPGAWEFTTVWGARVRTFSSANDETEHLAGESPALVIMVEAGQQAYEVYWTCLERTFGQVPLILSGTMENTHRWFADLFQQWQGANADGGRSWAIPTWSNLTKFPGGWDDPAIQLQRRRLPSDRFEARYGGKPGKTVGIVFREFDHAVHVRPIRYGAGGDPYALYVPAGTPLEAWIDWGWDHYYAILCGAVVNEEVFVLDEIALRHFDDADMIQVAQSRPWWRHVRRLILDVATKQNRGGETTWALWRRLTGLPVAGHWVDITEGNSRVRQLLKIDPITRRPRCWIDPKCSRLIWELSVGYRFPQSGAGDPVGVDKPLDKDNDCAAALRYAADDHFGAIGEARGKAVRSAPILSISQRLGRARRFA